MTTYKPLAPPWRPRSKVDACDSSGYPTRALACCILAYGAVLEGSHFSATAPSINTRSSSLSAADCARLPASILWLLAIASAFRFECQSYAKLFTKKQTQPITKIKAMRHIPGQNPKAFGKALTAKDTTGIIGTTPPATISARRTTSEEASGTNLIEGSNASKTIAGPPARDIIASSPSQIVFTRSYPFERSTSSCCEFIPHSLLDVRQMLTRFGGGG